MAASKTRTRTSRARRHKQIRCKRITEYMRMVETGRVRSCERQKKLMAYVRRVFAEEELFIDTERLEKYEGMLAFFPFHELFPWEWFVFTLFMCTFRADGQPRWDELIAVLGRGAGKNGFISFISWCLMTKANGIPFYDVNIVANSEKQAETSFLDVKRILDADRQVWKRMWEWNKTDITNKSTLSTLRYLTSNADTKDGGRPGLVVFDEVHMYKQWKIVEIMTTGLGKVDHGRTAYITSMGDVREGVLDSLIADCDAILDGKEDDAGRLPFVCTLDSADEVHDEANWEKPNPSWRWKPETFKAKMRKEYAKWLKNPTGGNASFMTRRMGIPQGDRDFDVTSYENLLRASREIPDMRGRRCVLGLDMARKDDFVSACLLFPEHGEDGDSYYAIHHSWLCRSSRDWERIDDQVKAYADERPDILTIVDDVEVPSRLVGDWIYEASGEYGIEMAACDFYRYDAIRDVLEDLGFSAKEKTVVFVRPSDHMRIQPVINSAFLTGRIAWGDDRLMRWFCNNTRLTPFQNSNYKYEKKEARGRKTDGFMALVAAFCAVGSLPDEAAEYELPEAFTW